MKENPDKEKKPEIDITDSIKVGQDYKLDREKAGLKKDFDIVDFALKHNQTYSVRKKSIVPKIIVCVVIILLIVAICVLGAILGSDNVESEVKKPSGGNLIGVWVSGDVTMYIDDKYITIGKEKNEYVLEDDNVIALRIEQEDYYDYYRMVYSIDGDNLTIVINDNEVGKKIEYKRKSS